MVEVVFVDTPFEDRYQRNNKRGGLKNLRCFPACAAAHRERGFCGRPVLVEVKSSDAKDNLFVVAEFMPVDEKPRFPVDSLIPKASVEPLIRSSENPLHPLMAADLVQQERIVSGGGSSSNSGETGEGMMKWTFEFNRKRKGWHYGWVGNKHSCNTGHTLMVYVFVDLGSGLLLCKSTTQSPSFVLFCRRRRRFVKVPTAPVSTPNTLQGHLNASSMKRSREAAAFSLADLLVNPSKKRSNNSLSDCESEGSSSTVTLETQSPQVPQQDSQGIVVKDEPQFDLNAMAHCLVSLSKNVGATSIA